MKVLSDAEFATRLGTDAAQLVRQNFGWPGVAATFADLCRVAIVDKTSKITQNQLEEPLQSVY